MKEFGFPLVTAIDGEPVASTAVIAAGMGQGHASVIRLTRRHAARLERFGRVRFEIQPFATRGGKQRREVAMLNERQAALLISLMRNTDEVIDFKVNLIEAFYRMREELGRREMSLYQQLQALVAEEVSTQVRASFGSRLMLERKRAIPGFRRRREQLESKIQQPLQLH